MLRTILWAIAIPLLVHASWGEARHPGAGSLGSQRPTAAGIRVAQGENNPPKITSMKIHLLSESDPRAGFRAEVDAQDPDGDPVIIRYQWVLNGEELPAEEEEALRWREEFKKGDELTLEAIPFDGKVEGIWKAQGSIRIPNSPPEITSAPEGSIDDGVFTYQVSAEDPDGDPIEYSLTGAPEGMSIEPTSGVISWNLEEHQPRGEVGFTVVASDNDGGTATQELKFNIPTQEENENQ